MERADGYAEVPVAEVRERAWSTLTLSSVSRATVENVGVLAGMSGKTVISRVDHGQNGRVSVLYTGWII